MFGGNKQPPEHGSNQMPSNPSQGTPTSSSSENAEKPPQALFSSVSSSTSVDQPPTTTTKSTPLVFNPSTLPSNSLFGNVTTSTVVPVFGREAPVTLFRPANQSEQTSSVFTSSGSVPFSNVFGKTGFGTSSYSVFQPPSTGNTPSPVFSSSPIKATPQSLKEKPQSVNVAVLPGSSELSRKIQSTLQTQSAQVMQMPHAPRSASADASAPHTSLFGGKSTGYTSFSGFSAGSTAAGYHFGKNVSPIPVFPVKGNPFASTTVPSTSSAVPPSHSSALFPKSSVFGGITFTGADKSAVEASPPQTFSEQQSGFPLPNQASNAKEQEYTFSQSNKASFHTIQQRDPRTTHRKPVPVFRSPATPSGSSSTSRNMPTYKKSKELEDIDVIGERDSQKRPSLQRPTLGLFEQALAGIKSKPQNRVTTKTTTPVKEELSAKQRRVSEEEVEARAHGHEVLLMSSEEVSKIRSIVCKGIPPKMNTERFIRHQFSKFGKVTRVYCNASKESAIIHFSNHKAAADAKRNGPSNFPVSPAVVIFWSQVSKKKDSPENKPSADKRPKSQSFAKYTPSFTPYDDEIAEELRSMTSCNLEAQQFLERPPDKSHHHDPPESDTNKISHTEKARCKERPTTMDKPSRKGRNSLIKASNSRSKKMAGSGPPISVSPKPDVQENSSSLLQIRAVTAGERFHVLDQRDKILRQKIKKDTNVETAANLRGTCPDMCPEKERYLREDRGQLHLFEMEISGEKGNNGPEVDHKAAVKEYSRSSADQEEPLPHELRSSDILSMTMDYLVCNFMDKLEQSDSSASEWFDFLWNRTRAIRKDITQQHLCDLTSLALVEKCARFHIHCAHYLCEEDISTFDQKINDENLTKCLQTLKHFYHDLKGKEIVCPHEAEFRAYDVLLNLFQGDTLRQVQQLSPDVQTSPEVRFAIQVFAAFNSNNYVRFFKLVTRASYLNACIMHRYFNHVRTKALHTLVRAHCPSANPVSYSVLEFGRLLGFEDSDEGQNFCHAHGIVAENGQLILDRGSICQPDSVALLKRGRCLVDGKRTCAIGEVVNGSPFPPNPYHTYLPHSSFGLDGHLNVSALDASDQIGGSEVVHAHSVTMDAELKKSVAGLPTLTSSLIFAPTSISVQDQPQLEQQFPLLPTGEPVVVPNELVKDIARELILSVLGDLFQEVGYDCFTNAQALTDAVLALTECYLMDVIASDVRVIVEEVYKELKLEHEQKQLQDAERAAKEKAARLEALRSIISQETERTLMDDLVKSETSSIVEEVITELKEEQKQLLIVECCKQYVDGFVMGFVENEILVIAEEVYTTAVRRENVLRKAEVFAHKLRLKSISHYFQRWRELVAKSRRIRRSEEEFPAIPGLGIHTSAGEPEKDKKFVLTTPLERLSEQMALCKLVDLGLQYQLVSANFLALPVNVVEAVSSFLFTDSMPPASKSSVQDAYWKLIVSLPTFSNFHSHCQQVAETCNWLKVKLSKQATGIGDIDQLHTLSLYSVELDKDQTQPTKRLSVCIKAVDGFLNSHLLKAVQQMHQFRGTQAVLYVLPPQSPTVTKQEQFWHEQNRRLEQMLDLCKSDPPVPLLVLVVRWDEDKLQKGNLSKNLKLDTLKHEGKISTAFVIALENDLAATETIVQLHTGISLLAQHVPQTPWLSRKYLSDFVEDIVTSFFFIPAYENLAQRHRLGLLNQPPEVLLELYNASIDHAVKVINSADIRHLASPVVEFCESPDHPDVPPLYWNSANHIAQLTKCVMPLKLPKYITHGCDSWDDVCEVVRTFIASVSAPDENSIILKSRINSLLKKTLYSFQQQCRALYYECDVEPSEDNVPWTEIIQACADYKLNLLPSFTSSCNELLVFYLEKDIQDFTFPSIWRQSLKRTHEEACVTLDQTLNRAATKRKLEDSVKEMNKKNKQQLTASPNLPSDSFERKKANVDALLSKIRSERIAADMFDKTLQLALQDGSLLSDTVVGPPADLTTPPVGLRSPVQHRHSTSSLSSTMPSKVTVQDSLAELQFMLQNERNKSQMFERRLKLFECLETFK